MKESQECTSGDSVTVLGTGHNRSCKYPYYVPHLKGLWRSIFGWNQTHVWNQFKKQLFWQDIRNKIPFYWTNSFIFFQKIYYKTLLESRALPWECLLKQHFSTVGTGPINGTRNFGNWTKKVWFLAVWNRVNLGAV